ncbi:tripartite tricarboxylate transporter substrate binding protein [soil metagenome]
MENAGPGEVARRWLSSRAAACAAALALAGLALLATPAGAQTSDGYPNKLVKVIVPFPPGGGGDVLARIVLTRVAKELGQPIVFENMAGAGGNIGVYNASRAQPDGYTLAYGTNGTHGINQTLYKSPGFNAEKDFAPISKLTRIAAMVVVRPDFPAKTMPELLALIRANPGKYSFGSAGNGTTSHLAGEMLKTAAGLQMTHIPYRGGALAMTDLLGGQIDLIIDVMPNTAPQVKGGKLRGLAVTTATRVASNPDIPTLAESGVPGFDVSAWDAVFAPAGTPPAIVDTINAAVRRALADPEIKQMLAERGAEPAPSSPDELRAFVKSEIVRWGAAVKASGATTD